MFGLGPLFLGCCFFKFLEPWDCWATRVLFELLLVLTRPRYKSFYCYLLRESQKASREGAFYLVPTKIRAPLIEWKVDTKTEYVGGNLASMP